MRRWWIQCLAVSVAVTMGCVNTRAITLGVLDSTPNGASAMSPSPASHQTSSPSPDSSSASSADPSPGPTSSPSSKGTPTPTPSPTLTPSPSPTRIPDFWASKDGKLVRIYRYWNYIHYLYRDNTPLMALASLSGKAYLETRGLDWEYYRSLFDDKRLFKDCFEVKCNDVTKPLRIDHDNGPDSFTPKLMWLEGAYVNQWSTNYGVTLQSTFLGWLSVPRREGVVNFIANTSLADVTPIGGGAKFQISTTGVTRMSSCLNCGSDTRRVAAGRHGMYFMRIDGMLMYISESTNRIIEVYKLPYAEVNDDDLDQYIFDYTKVVLDVAYDAPTSDPKDDVLWIRTGQSDNPYTEGRNLYYLRVGQMGIDL